MSIPPSRRPAKLSSPDSITPTPKPEGDDRVTGLFSLEGFSDAMALNDFDQEELVSTLINHIRSPNPRVSMEGIRTFWPIAKDIMGAAGKLTQQTLSTPLQSEHGKVTLTQSRTVLSPPAGRFSSGSFAAPVPLRPAVDPVPAPRDEPDPTPAPLDPPA